MDNFKIKQDIHISIPEHQVLISFDSDDDAEKFCEWFNDIGKYSFVDWCKMPDFKISDDFKKDYFG